jgi:hypothetical protein
MVAGANFSTSQQTEKIRRNTVQSINEAPERGPPGSH